jgi:hypothetical protein
VIYRMKESVDFITFHLNTWISPCDVTMTFKMNARITDYR